MAAIVLPAASERRNTRRPAAAYVLDIGADSTRTTPLTGAEWPVYTAPNVIAGTRAELKGRAAASAALAAASWYYWFSSPV